VAQKLSLNLTSSIKKNINNDETSDDMDYGKPNQNKLDIELYVSKSNLQP